MIKKSVSILFTTLCFCVLFSCGKEKEDAKTEITVENDSITNTVTIEEASDLKKFEIGKARLGPVAIGMTLAKAEGFLKAFTKQEAKAYDFGLDGGGKAFIYNYKSKPVLVLVPARDADSIIAIVAIDAKLTTKDGLHPKMKVEEIMPYYPNVKVHNNLMMEWEEIIDDVNGWEFVFMTNAKNRVGDYKNENEPAFPKRLNARCDWITIKRPDTNTDCTVLREGTFTYKDPQGDDVIVKVNDNIWTEEHKQGKYVTIAQMKWLNKCEYENKLIMSSIPGFKLAPGTVMNVTVDKVKAYDIYFTATAAGKSYHGKLTKI